MLVRAQQQYRPTVMHYVLDPESLFTVVYAIIYSNNYRIYICCNIQIKVIQNVEGKLFGNVRLKLSL